MRKVKKTEGKRFSRREGEILTADGLDFYLQKINWNDVFSTTTIANYRDRAITTLRANGIDVDDLLSDSPHGSAVRDFVLNHEDLAPDSVTGLASGLLETTLHILAYQEMTGSEQRLISLAYTFGRWATLFDIYEIDHRDHAKRRKDKPTSDPYDSGRNNRLRTFHAKLIAAGETDATKQTADEFDLSTKQVLRIVKQQRT